ncbi:hypothetical protein HZH68_005159 [Vespula germanica]|uniref:Uncharacterized protein n=1 Tax=Vespula germanica TaxID=30212 RepID=A0A834KFQ3_VESGE|nr:hypothetical protein HZH68_005159 [Vespula germanica]
MIKRSARIFNSGIFKDTKSRSRVTGINQEIRNTASSKCSFLDDDSTGEPKISRGEENAEERGKRDTELERDSCNVTTLYTVEVQRNNKDVRHNEDLKAPRLGDNYREPTLQPSKGLNVKRYTFQHHYGSFYALANACCESNKGIAGKSTSRYKIKINGSKKDCYS